MMYTPNNILLHIKRWMPQYIDSFTDETSVSAEILAGSPQILRVQLPNHGFSAGQQKLYVDSKIDNGINNVSYDSANEILTYTTNARHDLTTGGTAELLGFTNSQYNGDFEVINVPTALTFEVLGASLPILNGNEVIRESWQGQYGLNDILTIDNIVDVDTFDVLLTGKPTYDTLPIPQIKLVTNYRMGIVNDITRMEEIYTKNPPDDIWLFLIMEDVTASKDRNLDSDAIRADLNQTDQRVLNLGRYTIVVIIPTPNELTARNAVNFCYDEIYDAMLKVISGKSFADEIEYVCNLVSHGSTVYHRAYYGHAYEFEQPYETDYTDTFRDAGIESRAFRRINISFADIQDVSFLDLEG